MAYEIVNTLRSKSVIRIVGNTATTIALSALSANSDLEIVESATISYLACSTDGRWDIYRGDNTSGVLVCSLYGSVEIPLVQSDIVIANSATANIYVTNSGSGGTLLLQVSKATKYNTQLVGY